MRRRILVQKTTHEKSASFRTCHTEAHPSPMCETCHVFLHVAPDSSGPFRHTRQGPHNLVVSHSCPTVPNRHSDTFFQFIPIHSDSFRFIPIHRRQLFPPALPASSSRELFPPIVTRRIPSLSSIKVMAESAGERLETLSLAGSPSIRAAAIGEIAASARCLRQLSLSKCEGVDDAALDAILQLRSLEGLELSWCRGLSEESIGRLGQISSLRELRIAYTAASDQSIREIVTGANRLEVGKKSLKVEKKRKAVEL